MPYGDHWEWRGFGTITSGFAKRFFLLPAFYEKQFIIDEYLWIPGMGVNVKFRKGAESGLKFKRLKKTDGDFEVWLEDEDELFEFPLNSEAWNALSDMLANVDISLPPHPTPTPDRETTSEILQDLGCKIITVEKERETRKLEKSEGAILLEWATVKKPQHCTSVGLETWAENPEADLTDERALHLLEDTLSTLKIDEEPLRPMNYLDAIKTWAEENKI